MSSLCGCYYHVASTEYWVKMTKHYLPLLGSEAHSTILSTTSRTVLKQTFTNPSSSEAIEECIYTFPLYDGVSVVSFTCQIGSKVLRGLVKEKVKAKKIFDKAVASGETAGLLEQAPEAADVFSTKLGNIPAGKSVVVEITYIGELKHHETDGIRFTIPTSIAPRFGNGPFDTALHGNLPIQDNGGIKITVDVNMPKGSFIKGVQSPSHPIAVSMGTLSTASEADPLMSKASATLSLGSAALEKDFVLIVQCKDIGMPKAILERHPTIPNHRALMATLVPQFALPPSRPEIVFVADRSGSMRPNIPMLISSMKVFLKSMPVGVKFNICSFGSSYSFLWQQSKSYTSENLQQATAHVETFSANMGGTETFRAIKATVEQRFTDLPLEIILLTDGDIWQQTELVSYVNDQVQKTNGEIRVFPLGIGNGVSHALIEGLARAGNGFAQTVQLGERLDNCVVRMLRGALSPHITNYTLEVKYEKDDDDFEVIEKVTEGMKVLLSDSEGPRSTHAKPDHPSISLFDPKVNPEKEDVKMLDAQEPELPQIPYPKLLQAPHKIPTLFAFSRAGVYLLMSPETIQRNPTSVVLRATSVHGPLALEIPIEELATPAETIHQLAAKKAVQDLEEGRGWLFDAKDQAGISVKERFPSSFEDLVKKEAVRLGEKFQVAGKWCSFVAVSANDAEIAAKHVEGTAGDDRGVYGWSLELIAPSLSEEQDLALEEEGSDSDGGGISGGCLAAVSSRGSSKPSGFRTPQFRKSSRRTSSSAVIGVSEAADPWEYCCEAIPMEVAQTPSSANRKRAKELAQPAPLCTKAHRDSAPQAASSGSLFRGRSGFGSRGSSHSYRVARYAVPSRSSDNESSGSIQPSGNYGGAAAEILMAKIGNSGSFSNSGPAGVSMRCLRSGNNYSFAGQRSAAGGNCNSHRTLFSDASTEEVGWTAKPAIEKVLALISLQDFEGYWPEDGNELPAILGFEIPKCAHGASPEVWMTLLVVSFLEVKNGDEEGIWGLVVEKARGWLAGNVTEGLENLEKMAREFVVGH